MSEPEKFIVVGSMMNPDSPLLVTDSNISVKYFLLYFMDKTDSDLVSLTSWLGSLSELQGINMSLFKKTDQSPENNVMMIQMQAIVLKNSMMLMAEESLWESVRFSYEQIFKATFKRSMF